MFGSDFGCVSGEPLPRRSSRWTELVTSCPSWPCLGRVLTGTWVSQLKTSVRRSADGCRGSSRTWFRGTLGRTAGSPTRSVCIASVHHTEWCVMQLCGSVLGIWIRAVLLTGALLWLNTIRNISFYSTSKGTTKIPIPVSPMSFYLFLCFSLPTYFSFLHSYVLSLSLMVSLSFFPLPSLS